MCVYGGGGGGEYRADCLACRFCSSSLSVGDRAFCLDGLQKTLIYGGNACQTESYPSLPVYFGSGGGRGDRRIPISGFFAHAIVKKIICIMYIYLHVHVFLPSFFSSFFLITPIICKYCNLSRNFCNLPPCFTCKDCIML